MQLKGVQVLTSEVHIGKKCRVMVTSSHQEYTCQLSCIMRESHASGLLKKLILHINENFSRLTHKSGHIVL